MIASHVSSYLTAVSDQRPGRLKLSNVASEYLQCQVTYFSSISIGHCVRQGRDGISVLFVV